MRIKTILALTVITASTIVSLVSGPLATATAKFSDLSLDQQILAYHLSWEVDDCVKNTSSRSSHVSDSDAAKLDFLGGSDSISGTMAQGKAVGEGIDGRLGCGSAMKNLLSTLDISTNDPSTYMPIFGYQQALKSGGSCNPSNPSSCSQFDGWKPADNPEGTAKSNLKSYMTYQQYFGYEDLAYTLFTSCKATVAHTGAWQPSDDRSSTQEITIVSPDNKSTSKEVVKLPQPDNPGFSFGSAPTLAGLLKHDVSESGYRSQKDTNCMDVAEALNSPKAANALISTLPSYLADKPTTSQKTSGGGDTSDDSSDAPACNPNLGLGWLLCPVVNFLANIGDQAKGFIDSAMQIDTSTLLGLPGSDNTSAYSAWTKMRDIANVLFLMAFLFMIYSQLTSIGMSNYSIKKMMPKLIVVAILINASFYLCVAAVEVSNVVGQGVDSLISAGKCGSGDTSCIQVNSPNPDIQTSSTKGLAGLAATALAVGVVGYFFLPQVIAVIIYVAFIAMAAAIMLGIREALIVLLAIVSPLAFAAYLLPNTEAMYKKWWGLFKGLLYIYPIFGLLYGAGKLAATILGSAKNSDGSSNWELQIFGYIALFAGLFALPKLLEGALAVGGFASLVNRATSKARGATSSKAKSKIENGRWGEAKTARHARKQLRQVNRRLGNGRLATLGKSRAAQGRVGGGTMAFIGAAGSKFDKTAAGRYLGGSRGQAAATSALFKEFDEEVSRQKTLASGRSNEDLLKDLESGKGGDEYQAAIAGVIMSRSHRESHLKALDIMGKRNTAAEAAGDQKELETVSNIQKQMSQDMKSKPWALGDQATGQLVNGTYGRKTNHEGIEQEQYGDIEKELEHRIGTKLSASSLANMDPDEMKRISAAADSGLDDVKATSLVKAIREARANPQLDGLIKPEARQQHDRILEKYGSLVPEAPSTSAPATPATGGTTAPSATAPVRGPSLRGGETTTPSGLIVPRDPR